MTPSYKSSVRAILSEGMHHGTRLGDYNNIMWDPKRAGSRDSWSKTRSGMWRRNTGASTRSISSTSSSANITSTHLAATEVAPPEAL